MTTLEIVLGIILLAVAVFLVIAVLMQHGKAKNLSGTIAGGAETFLSKGKAKSLDAKLAKATKWFAIAFVILTLVLNLI